MSVMPKSPHKHEFEDDWLDEILNRFRDQIQADDGTALARDGVTYQEEARTQIVDKLLEMLPPEPYPKPSKEEDYDFYNNRHRYIQGVWVGYNQCRKEMEQAIKELL